jgi:hypothetical protein
MSSRAIDDIEDRLHDLVDALREAGGVETADMLARYARDFTVQTRVRRSVNAIREHLERWRLDPSELPDSPKVMLAANRLEDACRDALAAGVIVAAPLTLAAQSRRKLTLVLTTLLLSGVALLVPVLLVRSGVDLDDIAAERKLGPLSLPRGEESSIEIPVLAKTLQPDAAKGVEFVPLGGCKQPLPREATCAEAAPRLWADGRLPTYELKLKHQAYGLLFSLTDTKIESDVGIGRLLLAATDDTPEGRYEIPLSAAYLGYTPQSCELLDRVQGSCPRPRTGEGERHAGLQVPLVVVDVVPGDPARRLGEKRRAQAEAEEARRKADERAEQIGAALSEIQAVLLETEKLVNKRRWQDARERVHKLGTLFEPLESILLTQTESEQMPAQVSAVRARFEALRDKLEAFETRVFEQTFAAVTAESNRRVPEEKLLRRIGSGAGISPEYVGEIYTDRADEIKRRLDARAQAHMDSLKQAQQALEKRCGPLPKAAWQTVERYVKEAFAETRVEIVLGECMTPRLTERDCWEMRCDFQRKIEVAVERPRVVTKHTATFFLMNDRVLRHRDESGAGGGPISARTDEQPSSP